jgi:hypothetical protein
VGAHTVPAQHLRSGQVCPHRTCGAAQVSGAPVHVCPEPRAAAPLALLAGHQPTCAPLRRPSQHPVRAAKPPVRAGAGAGVRAACTVPEALVCRGRCAAQCRQTAHRPDARAGGAGSSRARRPERGESVATGRDAVRGSLGVTWDDGPQYHGRREEGFSAALQHHTQTRQFSGRKISLSDSRSARDATPVRRPGASLCRGALAGP